VQVIDRRFYYCLINKVSKKMKFAFCGNLDCPEWVLSEVAILNRMSAVKLKLILGQMVKKLTGVPFD